MRNLVVIFAFLIALPAHAQMSGGITIGEVAPDVAVTPAGGPPALLSSLQAGRAMLLVAFKST